MKKSADMSVIQCKQGYQSAWLIDDEQLLLQANDSVTLYDSANQKERYQLNGVNLPIADCILLTQHTLLTSSDKGTVQIWNIPNQSKLCQQLQPTTIQVSKFKIMSTTKHTDTQFIATDFLKILTIWDIKTQEKSYQHKFPFHIINVSSIDNNHLSLVTMDSSSYKKVTFTLDKKCYDVLWQADINGIVSNLNIIGVFEQGPHHMTIARAKNSSQTNDTVWLEQKNKDDNDSLYSLTATKKDKTTDNAPCTITMSKGIPRICFFYPNQNIAHIKSLEDNIEHLSQNN